jgi:hypothetical protein
VAAAAAPAPAPAPAELLLEGELQNPGVEWPRLRGLLGGRARLLPSTFQIAVTTLMGASPLTAGLIDDAAPVVLAAVDGGAAGVGIVAGVHVASGRELVVALSHGTDAAFSSLLDAEHGLIVLRPRVPTGMGTLGIIGDELLLASAPEHLRLAGAYVARTLASKPHGSAGLSLTFPRASLSGPLSALARARFDELRQSLQVADVTSRARHRGRAPDFGEPSAVIAAFSALFDHLLAVLGSASEVRVTASLVESAPELRVELVPGPSGAARELVLGLETGDLAPLLTLPAWTELAVIARGVGGGKEASPVRADRLAAILGDRLAPQDRARIEGWVGDLDRGLGSPFAIGLYADAGAYGAYATGAHGDGLALRRATAALAELVRIPALAAPLGELLGKIDVKRTDSQVAGIGGMTRLRVAVTPPAPRAAPSSPERSFEIVAASRSSRSAVVVAVGGVGPRLTDLLEPSAMLGADPRIALSVVRAGPSASQAVAFRVHPEVGEPSWAVVTVGSDRRILWADFAANAATLRGLSGALSTR